MQYYTLSNGNKFPKIGFGTYTITDSETIARTLNRAFDCGYTLIDTAYFYDNEKYIGDYLQGKNRNNYQIATKVWPSDFGYDNTLKSVERSLNSLGLDYIDVIYLHWPGDDMDKSYKALERLYDEKVISNIALANFLPKHYQYIKANMNIKPVINQLEIHPLMISDENIAYFKDRDIHIVSWAPIARANTKLMTNKDIISLAEKYGKTPAQIVLRWHIDRGFTPIPKSTNNDRIRENINIFDFSLDKEDIDIISSLDENMSVSKKPDDEKWLHKIRYS